MGKRGNMAWIPLHNDLRGNHKIKRIARDLQLSRPAVIGHMGMLWAWCMHNAGDGDVSKFNNDEIAEAAMYDDDPDQFVAVLLKHAALDKEDGRIVIHGWDEHGGKLIEKQRASAKRQEKWRNNHNSNDANSTTENSEKLRNDNVTVTERAREEKKREEKKREEESAAHATPPGEALGVESQVAMEIRKLCGKRGLVLSPFETKDLMFVLKNLPPEECTVERVQEFGKKYRRHWMGKRGSPPLIRQVYENWGAILDWVEPVENGEKHGKPNTRHTSAVAYLAEQNELEGTARDNAGSGS